QKYLLTNPYKLILNNIMKDHGQTIVRYNELYKGIPVYGYQLVTHTADNVTPSNTIAPDSFPTGRLATDLENYDIDTKPEISTDTVLSHLRTEFHYEISEPEIETIIYAENNTKPQLAYHISVFEKPNDKYENPNFIVRASLDTQGNLVVLQHWDNLKTSYYDRAVIGMSKGGTQAPLSFRKTGDNYYQFGSAFGDKVPLKLDGIHLTFQNGICYFKNNIAGVWSHKDIDLARYERLDSNFYKTHPVESYHCTPPNYVDTNGDQIAGDYSPDSDALYFVTKTIEMYEKYGFSAPIGSDQTVKILTHVGHLANAFATSARGVPFEVVFGDGDSRIPRIDLPLTNADVVAHEFSHLITMAHSNLNYYSQSGGLNESFSDMSAIALLDYLNAQNPDFTYDWTIGRGVSSQAIPLRWMDQPSRDNYSIDHASQFEEGMNPHASSGVFNRGFYILAHKSGWNVQKAFRVFAYANIHYWVPSSTFNYAACGATHAADDLYGTKASNDVANALKQVGAVCDK
ncbi:MAG: M4 family metallopeptidase, partial [Gammaproteobacteria bacterium]